MNKGDPRTRYTRKILRDSLIELMKKRPVGEIGIKEICAMADVSRSTFYTYYSDVFDLFEQIAEEAFGDVSGLLNQYAAASKRNNREVLEITQRILQYIADNSNSLKVLLSENGDIGFQKKFFAKFTALLQQAMKETSETAMDEKAHECYSVFVIYGGIGLVQYWLNNNMHIPVPELARLMIKLTQEIRR